MMRKLFFVVLVILEGTSSIKAQTKQQNLRKVLLNADTVLIVSHDNTGITLRDETGRDITPKLFINGKLNYGILHEQKIIKDSMRKKLLGILLLKNKNNKIVMNKCYMPQHAILIIKNHKVSFIDICFGCLKYEVSDDLSFFMDPFDINKWNELYQFFKQNGLKAMYGDKISDD